MNMKDPKPNSNLFATTCFLLLLALVFIPQAIQQQQYKQVLAPNSVVDTHQLLIDQLYRLTSIAGNLSSTQQQQAGISQSNKTILTSSLLAPTIAQLLAAAAAATSVTTAPPKRQVNSSTINNHRIRSPVSVDLPGTQVHRNANHTINVTQNNSNNNNNSASRSGQPTNQRQQQQQQQVAADSLLNVRQRWRTMENSLGESVGSLAQRLRFTFDEIIKQQVGKQREQVSNQCSESIISLLDSLAAQKLWAAQTVDASAKLPSGMLEGTLTELGNFDQCLAVQDSKGTFANQYCSIIIKPPLSARARLHTICQRLPALSASASLTSTPYNSSSSRVFRLLSQNSHHFYYTGLRLGLCLPSSCSRQDLQLLLTGYLSKFELLVQVKSCQLAKDQQQLESLDFVQQCIVSTFIGLLILSIFGTLVDFLTSHKKAQSCPTLQNHPNARQANRLQAGYSDEKPPQAAARRWHYQVYQNSKLSGVDQNVMSCQHHQQTPGIQRNPLAAEYPSTTTPYDNSNLPTSPSISSTSLSSCQQTQPKLGQHHHSHLIDNHNLDESWISEFERAQQRLDSYPSKAKKQIFSKERPDISGGSNRIPRALVSFSCCFSLKRNLQIIGRHAKSNKGVPANELDGSERRIADIEVIHGLRTIGMIWIIFGHTVGLVSPDMMNNLFSLAQLSCSSRLLQALLNTTLAVNTFFMISGLVTAISFARNCKSVSSMLFRDSSNYRITTTKIPDEVGKKKRTCSKSGLDLDLSSYDSSCSINLSAPSSSSSGNLSCSSSQGCNHNNNETVTSSVKTHQHCHANSSGHKQIRNNRKKSKTTIWPADFQPLVWLLLRYLRLTPAYAATIGLAIILPALGGGPFWPETVSEWGPTCSENWWKNLLYVNNFIGTERLCLIHSWYLSNDFQFFLVSLVILSIFYVSRKVACLFIIALILASSATTYALTMLNNFPPTIVTTSPAVAERWTFIHSLYYKPWPHLPSYLIGLCTGYLLLINERRPLEMSATSRAFAWILFSLLALALLNSIYPWNMGIQVDPIITSLHSSTYRSLWAVCCAWLVFALATKPQSWCSKFMSWHGFQVSSRLTFCAYLVHPLIIYYHFGNLRERLDSSPYGQLHRFMATLLLSYLFSLLLSLLIESPSIQLQRLITSSLTRPSKNNSSSRHTCFYPSSNSSTAGIINSDHQLMLINSDKASPIARAKQVVAAWGERSSVASTSSWTGTSSFGDQSCAALIKPARQHSGMRQASSQHQLAEPGSTELLRKSQSSSALHEQPTINHTSSSSEIYQKEDFAAATAHDAEFQRKLAQAISRGFRIRSRLAATSSNGTNTGRGKQGTTSAPHVVAQLRKQQLPSNDTHAHSVASGSVKTGEIQSNSRATRAAKQTTLRKVEFTTFFVPNQQQQQQHNHNIIRSQHQKGGVTSPSSSSREELKSAELVALARHL